MIPARGPAATSIPFWSRGWFWVLLALASLAPFVVAPLPMMPDYFSHIGRYHVMNHGGESPFLPRYYSYHWTLIGNLGVDLLMVPLGRILPTETAATVAAAIIPPLTIAGIFAVARAVWGRVEAPALLALTFVYTFSFLYGFVNFHLAVAVAFLVFALWVRSAHWSPTRRAVVFLVLGALVWVIHTAGWGVLLVLAAGWETMVERRAGGGWGRALVVAAKRCLPLAFPIVLVVAWRQRTAAPWEAPHFLWLMKLKWFYVVVKSESRLLDTATQAIILGIGAALAVSRRARREPRMMLAAGLLLLAYLLTPAVLFSSFYADERLLPVAEMAFLLAVAVPPGRARTAVAMIGLALFATRVAETTIGWHRRGVAAVAELAALDKVPRGSRIAVMSPPSSCTSGALTGHDHLPSLAIDRREAFVDTEWDNAGAQLMRPIYNLGHGYNDSSAVILDAGHRACTGSRSVADRLAELPRDRFDFVWVFDSVVPTVGWLRPVFVGPAGRLFAIVPDTSARQPG